MIMEQLKNRKDRIEYSGKLSEYQVFAKDRVMEYEVDAYSQYQNYLYKRALYGLTACTEDELAVMCSKKKARINNVYVKAQNVLNLYKQKITIAYTNSLFKTLFPKSSLTQFLLDSDIVDPNFKNTLTLKDLKISKDDIIKVFIKEGVLPKNFHELSMDPNMLPRLKQK